MSNYFYQSYGFCESNPSGILFHHSEEFSDVLEWSKLYPEYRINVFAYDKDNIELKHNLPEFTSADFTFELNRNKNV